MSGERILVIDDDPKILEILNVLLSGAGYEVRTTADPRQALPVATEFRPDLAILDIAMPVVDGFEVASRLRSDPALAGTRLIFLTARDATAWLRRAQELRAAAYVEKPFQKEALLGLLEQIFIHGTTGGRPCRG